MDERAVLARALWDELEEMGREELRALYGDPGDPRWRVMTTAERAGAVCEELGLIPYGPEIGSAPAHWERFAGVPVVRVYAMLAKWRSIETDAGKNAYLENWTKKYAPAFGGGEPE